MANRDMAVVTEPGDNQRYIRHARASQDLPPIDISDAKQVQARIDWYFEHCIDGDMKPTTAGLRNALGISKDTWANWLRGTYRSSTHSDPVQKANGTLEELMENYMHNGKINPVSGIFILKNCFGWQDKSEFVLTPHNNELSTADISEIQSRAAQLRASNDAPED